MKKLVISPNLFGYALTPLLRYDSDQKLMQEQAILSEKSRLAFMAQLDDLADEYQDLKSDDVLHNYMAGCLYGLVIGDALGQPLEFWSKPHKPTPLIEKYKKNSRIVQFKAGYMTDDGSMALNTLLVSSEIGLNGKILTEEDYIKYLNVYSAWAYEDHSFLSHTDGCCDIGLTISERLEQYKYEENKIDYVHYFKLNEIKPNKMLLANNSHSSGNGTIMKQAGVTLACIQSLPISHQEFDDVDDFLTWLFKTDLIYYSNYYSVAIGRLTHNSFINDNLNQVLNMILIANVYGNCCVKNFQNIDKKVYTDALFEKIRERLNIYQYNHQHKESIMELERILTPINWQELNEKDWSNTGYSVDTMETALAAFYQTDNFKDSIVKAINQYGDADTIGAVNGQIAGSYYGFSQIPEYHAKNLHKPHWLNILLQHLYAKQQYYIIP